MHYTFCFLYCSIALFVTYANQKPKQLVYILVNADLLHLGN